MSIKIETTLSSARKLQLESLVFLCLKAFPAPLSVPTDGDVYFFMEEPSYLGNGSAELLGLLALYETEEHLWDCSAFTRPDKRQEGIFSALLEEAETAYPEDQFSFPVPDSSQCLPALKTLEAIGAQLWYQEHLMTLTAGSPSWNLSFSGSARQPELPLQIKLEEENESGYTLAAKAFSGSVCIASCSVSVQTDGSQTSGCLYHVLVPEPLRGQGIGTRFLSALLPELNRQGISAFLLQVSGDNLPAIALYKKTGFQMKETLSYYLY